MNTQERRALAIRASQAIASEYGVPHGDPTVLKDTNHTIVHLRPTPIVAKVSIEKRVRHRSSSLEREVCVAGLLAGRGAPVVRPASSLPPGPHRTEGAELTFWNYYPGNESRPVLSEEVGRTLRVIHDTLIELRASLPTLPQFTLQLEEADELLQLSTSVPQLPEDDRLFLRGLHRAIAEGISKRHFENRPLHGECHPEQTISTPAGLLWLDYEAACLGPKEWDLATVDKETVEAYGTIDPPLLSLMRTARLFCVTTWCWTQPDRDPEIREAAEYHLENLKRSARVP